MDIEHLKKLTNINYITLNLSNIQISQIQLDNIKLGTNIYLQRQLIHSITLHNINFNAKEIKHGRFIFCIFFVDFTPTLPII